MTVIIPTHNGADTIRAVLAALLPQCQPADEVIVVNDGSDDETARRLDEVARMFRGQLWVMRQDRQGPAAARNTALRVSTSALVLFVGADILPSPWLLSRHRAIHARYPEDTVGCVGLVTWDPQLPPSPFMVWLEHGGSQNAYGMIAGHHWVSPASFFYAANLSCKRLPLERAGGFDAEHFPSYGWEDLDLGMRLITQGFRLYYEPAAVGLHRHRQTLDSWFERQRHVGRQLPKLLQRHAHLRAPRNTKGWRYVARLCVFALVGFIGRSCARAVQSVMIIPRLYQYVCSWEFTKSVHVSDLPHVDKSQNPQMKILNHE